MNLLAAGGFVSWAGASDAFLSQFHLQGVLAGFLIQGFVSLLVGLLYGAMLPMFPRYPIITAGFMAPLLFTGIVYSALGIVSPILNQRIDWFWFVMSQIAFGLVCGYVVNLQARVRTPQFRALPFAVRAGLHTDQAPSAAKQPRGSATMKILTARALIQCVLTCAVVFAISGCRNAPGRPGAETTRPDEVLDFPTLYGQNCAACHGEKGRNGAAISLANPGYLAVAGAVNIQRITAKGVPGTAMPPFGKVAGGMLTDQQIASPGGME